jgi:hypothetical protein
MSSPHLKTLAVKGDASAKVALVPGVRDLRLNIEGRDPLDARLCHRIPIKRHRRDGGALSAFSASDAAATRRSIALSRA